jgi:hypothetical protein
MLQVGLLTLDDIKFWKKKPIGFTAEGWRKILDFLKAVSEFINTSLRGPRTPQTNHLICAIASDENDTGPDGITLTETAYNDKKFKALELAKTLNPSDPIKQPEEGQQVQLELWFSAEYGNFVSAMLDRPIVVMRQVDDARALKNPKMSLAFFTPQPIHPTYMEEVGLTYFYGTWSAFILTKLRMVLRRNSWSDPLHIMLVQDSCHYQPYYKKRPGAQSTHLCPIYHAQ